MHVIGTVEEAWVENGRLLAIASLTFDTHSGQYRLDLTPPPSSGIVVDLETLAKLCVGTPVRVDNPRLVFEPPTHKVSYSIGVQPS